MPSEQDPAAEAASGARRPAAGARAIGRSRRTVRVALVGLVVVVLLGVGADRISLSEYSMAPGGAEPVGPLITVDGQQAKKGGSGRILLTDVLLTQLSLLTWLPAHLGKATEIVPESALVSPGQDPADLDAQGYLDMAQSKDDARAAALERLGYPVSSTKDGALVTAVALKSPASGELAVADVIVGAEGREVRSSCDLISILHDLPPGTKVDLSVAEAEISDSGTITRRAPKPVSLTTASPPKGVGASACPGSSGPPKSVLGLAVETKLEWHWPMTIDISTPNIGGPSAGLAMALGIIDRLSHGSLLHRSTIAATGTIDASGRVGDVGGVRQKAVAVSREHATLFLVPSNEGPTARSTADSSVTVVPVRTLDQALSVLLAKGGSITLANGQVERQASGR